MIGIVVPAHNEEGTIASCVASAVLAGTHAALQGEAVVVLVVLDRCQDGTGPIARSMGALTLSVDFANVGAARAAGAELLLAEGARWLGFTDADTLVSSSWLVDQLALNADAVCGSIGVEDWTPHGEHALSLEAHFRNTYSDCEGHSHIHGANLGVSADAYVRAGGFASLTCSEDVALVEALQRTGARIAWSALPRVVTSARADARARGGFGDTLLAVTAASLAALVIAQGAEGQKAF